MAQILSVSQLVTIFNDTLELSFPSLEVEGEVSGYRVWKNRLVFFGLKDESAHIDCMIPCAHLQVPIEDGMAVRILATPKVTKQGRLSVTVHRLNPSGEGASKRAFELLAKKLKSEGLFAVDRKRSLPVFPERIGVITATESAAYHDFMKILSQRWGGVEVQFIPVSVQGDYAPDEIADAIAQFSSQAQTVDTLVLIRGGGSLEDLAAFNTETVARAVAASRVPIIVGVGHEVDTSLADLAADVRAATPTEAAGLCVPHRDEIGELIGRLTTTMDTQLQSAIESMKDDVDERLSRLQDGLYQYRDSCNRLDQRLQEAGRGITKDVRMHHRQVSRNRDQLISSQDRLLMNQKTYIHQLSHILAQSNPQEVLRRGYGIVRHEGRVVANAATLKPGDRLVIQLAKDRIRTEVIDDEKE